MMYLDSNIFIYSILDGNKEGKKSRKLLNKIVDEDTLAITSSLTFDEILWKLMKFGSREKAIKECKKIMKIPNLKVIDVKSEDINTSFSLMKKYKKLKPRDAIHAAVSINAGVFTIASTDSDFDNMDEIDRMTL